jgi:hypothetical protein
MHPDIKSALPEAVHGAKRVATGRCTFRLLVHQELKTVHR